MKRTGCILFLFIAVLIIQAVNASPDNIDTKLIDIEIDPPGTVIIVTDQPDISTSGPNSPGTSTTIGPTISPVTGSTSPGPIPPIQGLQCGSNILLNPGNVVQMSSSNFGTGNYNAKETCNWNIQGNQCRLEASCPCVDIPPSYNCIQGYLKIRTGPIYDLQKFCGGNRPGQPIRSDSSELNVKFKGGSQTATGFTCFVSCIGAGQSSPTLPTVNCPVVTNG